MNNKLSLLSLGFMLCAFLLMSTDMSGQAVRKVGDIISKIDKSVTLTSSQKTQVQGIYNDLMSSASTPMSPQQRTTMKTQFVDRVEAILNNQQKTRFARFRERFLRN